MRVVLDTNVLIASFVARGVCTDVFERVINEHELFLSPHILREFERVMAVKMSLNRDRVQRAVALLERKASVLEPVPLDTPVCRDSNDDPVLALARDCNADCLVTGDDDLLILTTFERTRIISPREFLTFKQR